jgi:phage tail tape-measure protein
LRTVVASAAIGSAAGPIGTAIGGVVGSILTKFDSGGYTGDWGPQGKLAMLHEKELVLNATDTENLLSTIGLVREISNMIDI